VFSRALLCFSYGWDLFDLAIFLAGNWEVVYAREFQMSPEWAGRNQNNCTFIKSEYTGFVQNTTDVNRMEWILSLQNDLVIHDSRFLRQIEGSALDFSGTSEKYR